MQLTKEAAKKAVDERHSRAAIDHETRRRDMRLTCYHKVICTVQVLINLHRREQAE
jgi:hypothetical protein